jgi:prepilin-type N-terminal cleavage/methylation domain-containing protein
MISPIGKKKVNSAFTLIEILLVIVIAGIIGVLAVPSFSRGYARYQLKKTTEDLLGVSRWAQAMAMGQARVYALSFSPDHRYYGLQRARSNDEIENQDDFEAVGGSLGRMHAIPDGLKLHTKENRIEFYPDGTIDPVSIELDTLRQKKVISSAVIRGMMIETDDE